MASTLVHQTLRTTARCEMIDLTDRLNDLLAHEKITAGVMIVYVSHTTAAVTINENADPDVKSDMLAKLADLVPHKQTYYQHAEGNSDSHVKTALLGNSVTVLIDQSRLVLGQWQGIYFCEFDGPRNRTFYVKFAAF
jgi:secondary thiamine-phosphate synthase enzyme